MLRPRWGAATDIGRLRQENQDSWFAGRALFVVADGMGGQAAGGLASKLAVRELSQLEPSQPGNPAGSGEPTLSVEAIRAGVARANAALLAEGAAHAQHRGLGTTATGLAVLAGDRWAVFNVGDSRVYRHHAGRLEQLTTDHSAVQELIDAGLLDPAAAHDHPRRNVVTRSLGTDPAPVVDVEVREPVPGERFVICSDGLTIELVDAEIAQVLRDNAEPDAAARELVARAVSAGGRDNVTVIVVATATD